MTLSNLWGMEQMHSYMKINTVIMSSVFWFTSELQGICFLFSLGVPVLYLPPGSLSTRDYHIAAGNYLVGMDATYSLTKYPANTNFQELPERMIKNCPETFQPGSLCSALHLGSSAPYSKHFQTEHCVCAVHHPRSTGLIRSFPVPPAAPFQAHRGLQEPLGSLQTLVPHRLSGAEGEGKELTPHSSQRLLAGAQIWTCPLPVLPCEPGAHF